MKKLIFAAAASLLACQSAMASDWNGLYAGLGLSQNKSSAMYSDPTYDYWGNTLENRGSGMGESVYVGFNAGSEGALLGVELQYGDIGISDDYYYDGGLIADDYGDSLSLKLRTGVTIGQGLVYISAGLVDADISHSFSFPGAPYLPETDNDNRGYSYAVGVEGKVSQAVSVRMEFSETAFSDEETFSTGGAPYSLDDELSSFTLGAAFHF
ncbi:MAG: outer membrane beta-barrel protein [Alcanivoracaceae bacterium]|nr:outer membrane beta-barrel protein [Alcanivoracaceae bacterium]